MQRRSFIKNATAGAAVAAIAAPAIGQAQAQVRWRLASSFPKALDTIYGAAEVFSRQVSGCHRRQVSDQRARRRRNRCRRLAGGRCACSKPPSNARTRRLTTSSARIETFAMDCAIPFGLNSRQMTAWMFEGNGMKLFREFYRNYNIVNFPMGNTGAQMGGWYRKEIKSLADIKGLKMRIAGFGGRCFERARQRAAEHCRRRDLPGTREGHDRRGRVGRAVRRREARVL